MLPAPALGGGLRGVLSRGRAPGLLRQGQLSLFCSFTTPRRPAPTSPLLRPTTQALPATRRRQSTDTLSPRSKAEAEGETEAAPPANPRAELETALQDLQTHAANYVNLSRVQLALHNLRQPPGHESIRVAILGLTKPAANDADMTPGRTAKTLLRLVLADPLKPVEAWEAELEAHYVSQEPLIVRIGAEAPAHAHHGGRSADAPLATAGSHVIPEIHVSSPTLNQGNLEMLLMEAEADSLAAIAQSSEPRTLEDAVLAPTVDIAAFHSGSSTPVTTPVHMALLVGDGIMGAASILSLPILADRNTIAAAVNFKQLGAEDMSDVPFTRVNVDAGSEGLALFRASVRNVTEFETLWSDANVSQISDWLRANALPSSASGEPAATKAPVRNLVQSLLQNTRATIQAAEAHDLSLSLTASVPPRAIARLDRALADWAQTAHEELQHQLDVAFTGRPWRKLGWWKLFWRVDDVGMLSSEMLALRFLPDAERSIIYLAGRVQEAGIAEAEDHQTVYSGPVLPSPTTAEAGVAAAAAGPPEVRWPTHIPFTRTYLQDKTVPALQALAQKLVVQSLSTATLSTALAGLTYLSTFGLYESGAVAALGVIWSLRRLQTKWESARDFWEGEVREEGRKAVRASEASVAEVLDRATGAHGDRAVHMDELRRARDIVERAEDALAKLQ
ncbi:hypothetical protein B0T22DRAFT_204256 [Podospora appendiculata]|uniref:Mmc1 C-terminal domain-containing protein n=1 Tax=Podospora appendiculata TaxID=314037 RepID=A0AAE1C9U8_9PEZI|nr:hypothetical protein B0T22DRAFT_204256 [Podospora appendiculata]